MEKLFIIKIGGHVINDEKVLKVFLKNFSSIDAKKILVHGGGKIATEIGKKLGIESKYINGRRITDAATIDLVTMVYGGLVNKKIVALLQEFGCNAIGFTGADANMIPAVKRPVKEIDYGFVGDVNSRQLASTAVEGSWQLFLQNGLTPVVASLTHDQHGQMLNINADTIASSVAVALSRLYDVRLIYCFEKKGILKDINNEEDVVHFMDKAVYQKLMDEQVLTEGILPKLENAFNAIEQGVKEVLIGHADDVVKNTTEQISGTLIK